MTGNGDGQQTLLLDKRGIMRELGVSRYVAERIIADITPKVRLGRSRVFVYRKDVIAHVRDSETPA